MYSFVLFARLWGGPLYFGRGLTFMHYVNSGLDCTHNGPDCVTVWLSSCLTRYFRLKIPSCCIPPCTILASAMPRLRDAADRHPRKSAFFGWQPVPFMSALGLRFFYSLFEVFFLFYKWIKPVGTKKRNAQTRKIRRIPSIYQFVFTRKPKTDDASGVHK